MCLRLVNSALLGLIFSFYRNHCDHELPYPIQGSTEKKARGRRSRNSQVNSLGRGGYFLKAHRNLARSSHILLWKWWQGTVENGSRIRQYRSTNTVSSQPTEYRITITNGSARFAAYQVSYSYSNPSLQYPLQVLSTDSAIFSAIPAHGIVRPGEKQNVKLQYANQQEVSNVDRTHCTTHLTIQQTEQHHFRVYVALTDSYSLPGEFLSAAPPTQAHGRLPYLGLQ